ncbi:MAG: MotA/TolQ/ExbB proton channel family protein [Elusimicrobia bacterium]|nr:MotA/TolQ/ExbB proton channel family protein [Elusimicrobiota bacterium]
MDFTTVMGVVGTIGLIWASVATGQLTQVFLNVHGFLLVLGGTAVAMLLNTPGVLLRQSFRSIRILFTGNAQDTRTMQAALVKVAEEVHANGLNALRNADPRVGDGFLTHAAQVALELNDAKQTEALLDNEIIQELDKDNEVVNVYRTIGVLSPMFGLVGTLIGIIQVLRDISNPEQVGNSMAVAITTAFYGILLANLVAVPLAGKLRVRFWEKYLMRRMIVETLTELMKGTVPAVLERKLASYVTEG